MIRGIVRRVFQFLVSIVVFCIFVCAIFCLAIGDFRQGE